MTAPTTPKELVNEVLELYRTPHVAVTWRAKAAALIAETFERWAESRKYPVELVEEIAARYLIRVEAAEKRVRELEEGLRRIDQGGESLSDRKIARALFKEAAE